MQTARQIGVPPWHGETWLAALGEFPEAGLPDSDFTPDNHFLQKNPIDCSADPNLFESSEHLVNNAVTRQILVNGTYLVFLQTRARRQEKWSGARLQCFGSSSTLLPAFLWAQYYLELNGSAWGECRVRELGHR